MTSKRHTRPNNRFKRKKLVCCIQPPDFMALARGESSSAGLQTCDRSKITLIATTLPQEGGFGKLRIQIHSFKA
jgi:hypothetical protein